MISTAMQDAAMADLLEIREAAEFLRVSETSLHRWTNAGRLPVLPIGGRRERRLRRGDLRACLGAAGAASRGGGGGGRVGGAWGGGGQGGGRGGGGGGAAACRLPRFSTTKPSTADPSPGGFR